MRPGYRTTEFWVTVAIQIIGILATTDVLTPEKADSVTRAVTQIGGVVAMVASAFGYSISRGMAKKGQ